MQNRYVKNDIIANRKTSIDSDLVYSHHPDVNMEVRRP